MKGSKSLGRRTAQRFWSKTWDEGFKSFGKKNGSNILFKDEGFKEFGKEKQDFG